MPVLLTGAVVIGVALFAAWLGKRYSAAQQYNADTWTHRRARIAWTDDEEGA